LKVDLDQATISSKIIAVRLTVAMEIAVVLMDPSSSDQPQVSPRYKAALLIKDLLLRLDIDAGCLMQDSDDRFPWRFAALVEKGQYGAETGCATAFQGSGGLELINGAMPQAQRGIAHDHQIKQSKVARRCKQCLSATGHSQPADSHGWNRFRMTSHE
jgi:hypothetical protein